MFCILFKNQFFWLLIVVNKDMINIAILINSLNKGGAERVVSILTHNLFRDNPNIKIHLIVLENKFEYAVNENTQIKILDKDRNGLLTKTLLLPILAFRLKQYCLKNDIHIVMSFLYRSNYINVMARLLGLQHQVLLSERSIASQTYVGKSIKSIVNRVLLRWLYKKANFIITVSNGVQNDLINNFSISKERLITINNPYDIDFIIGQSEVPIKEEWLNNPKYKVIVSVGRLIPNKRINDIILAIKQHSEINNSLRAIFVGDGSEKNSLIKLTKSLGIQKLIKFTGVLNNPFAYLSKADAFVSASEREGFPNVLVEAMVCNCPVISTDCKSGPNEIIEDGKSGILVPVGNIEKIAEAIEKVIADSPFSKMLVNYARIRVEDFSVKNIMPKYEKIISDVWQR